MRNSVNCGEVEIRALKSSNVEYKSIRIFDREVYLKSIFFFDVSIIAKKITWNKLIQ